MKKNPLIFYLIGLSSVMMFCSVPAAAQQPSVVVDGLRYEKIAEGKAKLIGVDNLETYEQTVINNNTIIIPNTIKINNEELTVTRIKPNVLRSVNERESLVLPASIEYIGFEELSCLYHVDSLIINSFHPIETNFNALFCEGPIDRFASGLMPFLVKKIIVPKGASKYYLNAPGWKYLIGSTYSYNPENSTYNYTTIAESDSVFPEKKPDYLEYNGWVGKINSQKEKTATLLYKIMDQDEMELNIPSFLPTDSCNYTVNELGEEIFLFGRFSKLYIPETVKRIGHLAFAGSKIYEISGMNGVEYLGEASFALPNLRKLILPESMTTLTSYAFAFGRYDGSFDEITLPSSLAEIEEYCFCDVALKKVISLNPVAPKVDFNFYASDYPLLGDLIVPEGSEESYLAQPGWRRFARINGVKYADYVTPLYDQATITTHGRSISITTASELRYEIYSSAGVMVAAGTTGQDIDIALENPGIYVVKVSAASASAAPLTTKIAIR